MAKRCPYLGLDSNRSQALPEPTPRHRCHKPGRPERVGISHQAQVCLASAHFRCPRLVLSEPAAPSATRAEIASVASPGQGARRPVTLTELMVMGLGVSLAFAGPFVGLAVIYRLQVGPGISAAPEVAVGSKLAPTLVPTFTPTIPAVASASSTLPTATRPILAPTAPPVRPPAPRRQRGW